jgi:hypothetical protein
VAPCKGKFHWSDKLSTSNKNNEHQKRINFQGSSIYWISDCYLEAPVFENISQWRVSHWIKIACLSLMLIPCIIRRIRNYQQYALICTTPLFYVLAPTCFGSSLPSSGSFLDTSELIEIQIEWVVYHIMCGYVACVPVCRGFVCTQLGSTMDDTTTIRHTGHITTHFMIYHPFNVYFK